MGTLLSMIVTEYGDPVSWWTGGVRDAELHRKVVSWDTLAEPVMCGVTLPLDKLPLLADWGAVLAALAPMPLFSKSPLRTWSAHSG